MDVLGMGTPDRKKLQDEKDLYAVTIVNTFQVSSRIQSLDNNVLSECKQKILVYVALFDEWETEVVLLYHHFQVVFI